MLQRDAGFFSLVDDEFRNFVESQFPHVSSSLSEPSIAVGMTAAVVAAL